MRPPQRLDGVIGDLREGDDDTKIRGNVALFVIGLLFFVQSLIIAAQFFLQKVRPEVTSLAGSVFGCLGCWLWAWYLSSANPRKRWLKVTLITLLVVYVSVGLTVTSIQFVHDRRVEGQAKHWFAEAQEDAEPTWTEDDAIHWCRHHDIPDARRGVGARISEKKSEQYDSVDGYRQIENGGLIFRPASVHITFIFDCLDHKFKRVEYDVLPYEPPWGADRRK